MHSVLVRLVLVTTFLGTSAPSPAFAQSASDDERAVRQTVETFLDDLGRQDYHRVAAALTSKALVVISRQRDGAFVPTVLTRDDWLGSLWGNRGSRFEEPLSNVRVTVESGHLAHLRADFKVVRDGTVLSSGVDHFMLVRDGSGWKIAAIAFTSIPAAPPAQ